MILLDTCALLWWSLDPKKMSDKAGKVCEGMGESAGIVSSISLWEIGVKIRNGKLDIGMSLRRYAEKLRQLSQIKIVPVDGEIWIANVELDWQHRDPADRTIVATAKSLGIPIVTCDRIIRDYYRKTIW